MNVLNLFTTEKSVWTVQEVCSSLQVPLSTIYRTMRELTGVNMLHLARDGHYRLGPAFIEFDRRTRLTDPLTQRASTMLVDIVQHAGVPCLALLARLYGNTVMCVADAKSPGSAVQSSYERGRPMPLTRGATSKVILAQLPPRRLKKVLETAGSAPSDAVMDSFRKELLTIRKNGYAIGHGEVDRERVGVAVPVSIPEQDIIASLSLVLYAGQWNDIVQRRLVPLLVSSAAVLSEQLMPGTAFAR